MFHAPVLVVFVNTNWENNVIYSSAGIFSQYKMKK